MISFAEPLPIGNAVRVLLAPAQAATEWRLLRKTIGTFTDQNDPNALLVYDGHDEINIVDLTTLTNGTPYFYCEFEFDGAAWTASPVISVTPASAFGEQGPDTLDFVRSRIEQGLRAAVAATNSGLSHDNAYIPVLTAPPLFENTKWPVVSVHLQNDVPAERGIGEILSPDDFDVANDQYDTGEGWLASIRLQIVGWCLNPDERIALRKALKAIMIGNLPVFESAGMTLVTFSQSDVEDFESYNAPVYETIGDFNCLAPSIITSTEPAIDDVTVDAEAA